MMVPHKITLQCAYSATDVCIISITTQKHHLLIHVATLLERYRQTLSNCATPLHIDIVSCCLPWNVIVENYDFQLFTEELIVENMSKLLALDKLGTLFKIIKTNGGITGTLFKLFRYVK